MNIQFLLHLKILIKKLLLIVDQKIMILNLLLIFFKLKLIKVKVLKILLLKAINLKKVLMKIQNLILLYIKEEKA